MKNKLLMLLMAGSTANGFAQDVHFSQFELPLLRNPALAGGFNGLYRVQTVYRTQWYGVHDPAASARPYLTTGGGGEYKFIGHCMDDPTTVTAGGQVLVDQAGVGLLKHTSVLLSLTVKQMTSKMAEDKKNNNGEKAHVSFGVYGGWVGSGFNFANLRWGDQYNGSLNLRPTTQPFPVTQKGYLDFGAGALFNYKSLSNQRFYAGVGWHHINQPNTGFDGTDNPKNRLPFRWAFNCGMFFLSEDERGDFRVYADVMRQGRQNQFLFGALYKQSLDDRFNVANDDALSMSGGIFYRFNDAVIPVINLNWMRWTFGVSYDCRVVSFTDNYRPYGTFEFTLKFRGVRPGETTNDCDGIGCD